MINLFKGLKLTLVSTSLLTMVMLIIFYTQVYWFSSQQLILPIFYFLAIVLTVFAAQFSQSRFSWLILSLVAWYLSNQAWIGGLANTSLFFPYWQKDKLWQITSMCFVLGYFSFIKDRALLSIYMLSRLLGIASCLILAYLCVLGARQLVTLPQVPVSMHALLLHLPLAIALLVLLVRSVLIQQVIQPALLATGVILSAYYWHVISLPIWASLLVLTVYYLLSVIANAYFLAYRDELTGLPSRRALYQKALSLGRTYSVAMLDVDHFKKFNDTYGHDVGDQVLKLVAAKLNKVKRGGCVYRYGGEEFTVIFPGKNAELVVDELDKLRQSVADYKMAIRQGERKGKDARKNSKNNGTKMVSVTISIGVASHQKKQSFAEVMKAADLKLYQAKKNGRNNVSS